MNIFRLGILLAIFFSYAACANIREVPRNNHAPIKSTTLPDLSLTVQAPPGLIHVPELGMGIDKVSFCYADKEDTQESNWPCLPTNSQTTTKHLHQFSTPGNISSLALFNITTQATDDIVAITKTNQSCIPQVKGVFYSNQKAFKNAFEYRISFYIWDNFFLHRQLIRPIFLCSVASNKLAVKLGYLINNYLLPVEFVSYDNKNDKTGRVIIYLPKA